MAIDVRLPSITGPTDSARITQITRYLYQLAEDLKYNLNTLEAGTSDMASIERIGVIDSLDDWKLTAQTSIATIRQKVSSQGASIEMLTEWKSGVEDEISSIASIKQMATSQGASIEILTEWKNGVNDNVSSIAQIKQDVSANVARITSLAEWKSGVEGDVSSIASIKQMATSQGASIEMLTEWRGKVEGDVSSIASIEQRVTDAESTIKLLTDLNNGDATSLAELVNRVSSTEASIAGLTTWKNSVVGSIAKIEQISTEDYSSITGLARFKSDTAATEARIEGIANSNKASISLVVDNGTVKGGVLVEAINKETALKISADRLDIEGKTLNIKVASTNITGQLKADQIDASNLKVAAANITGGLTIGQLPSNVATSENIPKNVGDLTNNVGYQTSSGVVSIIDGRITADFIKTLGLEVGNHIKMGSGATISWERVSGKPTNLATTANVSNAQNAAITSALDSVSRLGYQTESQVKTVISESSIRTDQIECTDLNAFGATIGGFTIDNNSLHSSMNSTTNRILLCSGTSARYTVGDYSSTGWSIIAGSNFGVLKNGTAYMNNAHIKGVITATSGFIGNCYIQDGAIVSANSNFSISPEGDFYANGGVIGGFEIRDNAIHSMTGIYGTYSYTTTGTNLKYATGYAFTVMTPSGICYYINQSDDFNSKTLAIIHQQIGGSGISGEDKSGGIT